MKDYLRIFEITDTETGTIHTCNGEEIMQTLCAIFPQFDAIAALDFIEIEDMALFGTTDYARYILVKATEHDYGISVSELI